MGLHSCLPSVQYSSIYSLMTLIMEWRVRLKFTDDSKLGRVASTSEDKIRIQNSLDKLEHWSDTNRMKFNKDKCSTLHLGRKNKMYNYKMGNRLGNSTAEKDLRVIVDPKLNESM